MGPLGRASPRGGRVRSGPRCGSCLRVAGLARSAWACVAQERTSGSRPVPRVSPSQGPLFGDSAARVGGRGQVRSPRGTSPWGVVQDDSADSAAGRASREAGGGQRPGALQGSPAGDLSAVPGWGQGQAGGCCGATLGTGQGCCPGHTPQAPSLHSAPPPPPVLSFPVSPALLRTTRMEVVGFGKSVTQVSRGTYLDRMCPHVHLTRRSDRVVDSR